MNPIKLMILTRFERLPRVLVVTLTSNQTRISPYD